MTSKGLRLRVAAEIIGCHTDTLKKYIRLGKLRAYRLPSGYLMIREAEVERFITERENGLASVSAPSNLM